MNYTSAVNTYRQASVSTASREKLLLMLYDGLVRFLKQAIVSIDAKDIQGSHTNLIKAQNIIVELMSTLDMSVGGGLPQSLYLLYDYMNRRLVEANIHKNKETVIEVLGYAEELKDAFEQAYKQLKK